MSKINYKTRIVFDTPEDKAKILVILDKYKFTWNECSAIKFSSVPKNSIVDLHAAFYTNFRQNHPEIPSQIIIGVQRSVLSIYRGIKSKKHKIKKPPVKKQLSMQLDKRMYSYKNGIFSLKSIEKRVKCKLHMYDKLEGLMQTYKFCDPLLFVKDDEVYMCLTFDIPETVPTNKLVLGVDLGIVNFAATSEGKLYQDKKFNKEKRRLRYQKRMLRSAAYKGSRTAKKHLRKLTHKEANKNRNFSHHLANHIIKDTQADTIVLENLKSIKVKKHKYQNKNRISQIPLYQLREFLTYKALLHNKQVITVSPAYTSQIDHRTGERDGLRVGGRYIGSDGQILHADCNAACNIAIRSKLPCSIGNYYVWQAKVNSPIVA